MGLNSKTKKSCKQFSNCLIEVKSQFIITIMKEGKRENDVKIGNLSNGFKSVFLSYGYFTCFTQMKLILYHGFKFCLQIVSVLEGITLGSGFTTTEGPTEFKTKKNNYTHFI